MKKILGLDLGVASIGWAIVNEAEDKNERSSIIKIGVRVNPLTTDEQTNFDKGKTVSAAAERTKSRSARRNLQRYKLRRENLIEILKENSIISNDFIFSEDGNETTFKTYKNRAIAACDKIPLEEFVRVLFMINKKRGYKSSRKAKSEDEGQLIDGMEVAKQLYENNLTPGQFVFDLLKKDKKYIPDFYRSDLQNEFNKIWDFQKQFHSNFLTDDLYEKLKGLKKIATKDVLLKSIKIEPLELKGKWNEKRLHRYELRSKAISIQLNIQEVVETLVEINGEINNSSGYLGAISDRSKELYFNKQTVGQNLYAQLQTNPHTSLKKQIFYRQDYLDEFNTIWETQAKYHKALTPELKSEIRDIIIFYQRKLKSQKGLISFCEFEQKSIEVEIDGKKKTKIRGSRVIPKSSPLFQEFKIWQTINNLEVTDKTSKQKYKLEIEDKQKLFDELNIKPKLSKSEILKLLYKKPTELDLNFKDIDGNKTNASLFDAYAKIIELSGNGEHDFSKMSSQEIKKIVSEIFKTQNFNTEILEFDSSIDGNNFDKQVQYQLWHLLYSFEDDNSKTGIEKLLIALKDKFGFDTEYAKILANVSLQNDYGSLSAKAIRKILPYLKEGNKYDVACTYAGYNHSKKSLTKEEKANKVYKTKLDILPKNSLRNPIVEKILNQMINVVNTVIEKYGKPDEIRIELARELKKSGDERKELDENMRKTKEEHEKYRKILHTEFGLAHVSRNDIIRYKLYLELKDNGYKTLYSNTYIAPNELFSKNFDIEHIIPKAKLFDDSFSNKTLELRSVNQLKGDFTAIDFVNEKYTDDLENYKNRVELLFKTYKISKTKYKKLMMAGSEIPSGFIDRDLRDTQYIAKKAKEMLEEVIKEVTTTTGTVTDKLREDWQLVDIMQELNWDNYKALGLTEEFTNRDGQVIKRIKDWTKRNDHRHHAMDAITIAYTKRSHIQYLNNLNARSDKSSSIYGIEKNELYRDSKNKLRFNPPIPLDDFRAEAKYHLENTLISIKSKNKVVTKNKNTFKIKDGKKIKIELTPRGQLHLETVYGNTKKQVSAIESINGSFDIDKIEKVTNKEYKEALIKRLAEFENNPKIAFAGKNSLDKKPIYLNDLQTNRVPEKIKLAWTETIYTIRKDITPDLKVEKILDKNIKTVLENRLKEYKDDAKAAFSNLVENPIWLNKEKGICIKRVTISGISNAVALHSKKDKDGKLMLDKNKKEIPVDFVNSGNNHHAAIYIDENGKLHDTVISFYETVQRVTQDLPIIDKSLNHDIGWKFLFSIKQNEYFVFPNNETGFNPKEVDLLDENNYALISPNLFRVQKFSKVESGNSSIRDYVFRYHLETVVQRKNKEGKPIDEKPLRNIIYKRLQSLADFDKMVKVRINHLGEIIKIGE
jgi:CRISPR-associated endonuclease Csn1